MPLPTTSRWRVRSLLLNWSSASLLMSSSLLIILRAVAVPRSSDGHGIGRLWSHLAAFSIGTMGTRYSSCTSCVRSNCFSGGGWHLVHGRQRPDGSTLPLPTDGEREYGGVLLQTAHQMPAVNGNKRTRNEIASLGSQQQHGAIQRLRRAEAALRHARQHFLAVG